MMDFASHIRGEGQPLRGAYLSGLPGLKGVPNLRLSDGFLLAGISVLPFLRPIPGSYDQAPSSLLIGRLAISDFLLGVAVFLVVVRWTVNGIFGKSTSVIAKKSVSSKRVRSSVKQQYLRLKKVSSRNRAVPRLGGKWSMTGRNWKTMTVHAIWYATGCFLLVALFSWLANPSLLVSPRMISAWVIQAYLLSVGIVVAEAVQRWGTVRPIFVVWMFAFGLLSILCLHDVLAIVSGWELLYPGSRPYLLRGPFRTSAQLAHYSLSSFFVLLAGGMWLKGTSRQHGLSCLFGVLAAMFIVMASRRSAFVALLLGSLVLVVLVRSRIHIMCKVLLPFVLFSVAIFYWGPPELSQFMSRRVAPLIGNNQAKVETTIDHFQHAFEVIREFPVLGIGFGGFKESRFGEFENLTTHEQHSGYLAILAETGLLGFAIVMWIHSIVGKYIVSLWKRGSSRIRELSGYLAAFLFAISVSEIYNRIWRERALWIVLGMIVSLMIFSQIEERKSKSSKSLVKTGVL